MNRTARKHLLGLGAVAATAAFISAAAAAGLPLPMKKPVSAPAAVVSESLAGEDFILSIAPQRKPLVGAGEVAAKPVKTAKVVTNTIDLPRPLPKPDQQAVVVTLSDEARVQEAERIIAAATAEADSSQQAKTAAIRLPENFLQRKPTLMSRVFGPGKRLSDDDSARYAHIFAFQDVGDFTRANAEIEKLGDLRLIGHVLQQRYMSSDYAATYAELADWMKNFADLPGAQKIYDLAMKKRPKGMAQPVAAKTSRGVYGMHDFDVGQLAQPYMGDQRHSPRQRDLMKSISHVVSSSPTTALKRLDKDETRNAFDDTGYDSLRGNIAASYFYNNKIEKAYELASASALRSGADVPQAGWIAGLAAWRMKDYGAAAKHFESAAKSGRSSAWMTAAAAHWAARSHLRDRQPQKVGYWLRKAAEYPRTFYGIISMKALGMEQARFNWEVPELSDKHIKALAALPAGRRALALVDAERPDLAEQELRQMNPSGNEVLQEAMIAMANDNGMPALAMRMGSSFKGKSGKLYDAALYPDAPWSPEKGFYVDKALVYAFIRQESKFEPDASNRSSGATGLMQLMPGTAKHVARAHGDSIAHDRLQDPMLNIDLGQKYLHELLNNSVVGNNLFKLCVAYNAGPGKLARWEQEANYPDDPLLFIESIPAAETRIFVERVLTNYWIYRLKYKQDLNSLDRVAEGTWPVYVAQDNTRRGSIFASAGNVMAP